MGILLLRLRWRSLILKALKRHVVLRVYWRGVELANGFSELTCVAEQRRRFEMDNAWRKENGLPQMSIDEHFLTALEVGLPECAGVALGLDRLIMILLELSDLTEVAAFPADRA